MSKALSQRNIEELLEIYTRHDIDIPDGDGDEGPTKKELLFTLKEHGIDNKAVRNWEAKQENKLDIKEYDGDDGAPQQIITGDVVVCMTRRNPIFIWGKHRFSADRRFIPMPKEQALELVQAYEGFHIATREEIKRHYR